MISAHYSMDNTDGKEPHAWIYARTSEEPQHKAVLLLNTSDCEQIAYKLNKYLVAIGERKEHRWTARALLGDDFILYECPECSARYHGFDVNERGCPDCGEMVGIPV
jgi:hypothetical protein